MNKKIFINGCFDILHRGHIEMFKYAKSLGDILIVAIDADNRVRKLKGDSRPINNQNDRKFMLSSIKYIDKVEIFYSNSDLEQIIRKINPDIMIVGSDYKEKPVIGSQYAKCLQLFDKIDGYSTTKIIQSIINRR